MVQVNVRVLGGESVSKETAPVSSSAHPKWRAVMDFPVPPPDKLDLVIVSFKVWDVRALGRAFLGQVALPLSELPGDASYATAPLEWYLLENPHEKLSFTRHIKLRFGLVAVAAGASDGQSNIAIPLPAQPPLPMSRSMSLRMPRLFSTHLTFISSF